MNATIYRGLAGLFVVIGTGAVIAPRPCAAQFGLPTDDPTALAFVRSVGARDAIIGVLIFAALGNPRRLRTTLAVAAPAGFADAFALASVRGLRPQHIVHLGGAIALLWAAAAAERPAD